MSLAAWAKATEHVRLGLLVGANTFRNPGLTAKLATTLDHMSNGRAILGVGGAWFDTSTRQWDRVRQRGRPAPGLDGRGGGRHAHAARRRPVPPAGWPLPVR